MVSTSSSCDVRGHVCRAPWDGRMGAAAMLGTSFYLRCYCSRSIIRHKFTARSWQKTARLDVPRRHASLPAPIPPSRIVIPWPDLGNRDVVGLGHRGEPSLFRTCAGLARSGRENRRDQREPRFAWWRLVGIGGGRRVAGVHDTLDRAFQQQRKAMIFGSGHIVRVWRRHDVVILSSDAANQRSKL